MLLYRSLPDEPERAFVLGAGRFGSAAARKTAARWPSCEIHLADTKPVIDQTLPGIHHPGEDAFNLLSSMLVPERPDDLVIPCVPVHAAFNWVLQHLGFSIPVPIRLMEKLPGAVYGRDGCIYSSLSDLACPDDCSEPVVYCTLTGEERGSPLFETMASIKEISYTTIVLRSGQLLPGTGALTAGILFDLLNTVRSAKGRYLIATASRCHGVIHGFTR